MVKCEDVFEELHRYVDDESRGAPRERLDAHLRECPSCRQLLQQLRRENTFLVEVLADVTVPRRVRRRVLRQVEPASSWRPSWSLATAAVLLLALGFWAFWPAPPAAPITAVSRILGGRVLVARRGAARALALADRVFPGDRIHTRPGQPVYLALENQAQFVLRQLTAFRLARPTRGGPTMRFYLHRGELLAKFPPEAGAFEIETAAGSITGSSADLDIRIERPDGSIADRPPVFIRCSLPFGAVGLSAQPVRIVGNTTVVTIIRGRAQVSNRYGALIVPAGQTVRLRPDRAPFDLKLADLDVALAWTRGPRVVVARRLAPPPLPKESTTRAATAPQPSLPGPTRSAPATGARPLRPIPAAVLGAPVDLTAEMVFGAVRLTWKPDPRSTAPALGYDVYRRTPTESEFTAINPAPIPSALAMMTFLDENVEPGMDYIYAVAAVGAPGLADLSKSKESDLSLSARITARPFVLRLVGGNDRMATLHIRKLHEGVWAETTFVVRKGEAIGGLRRLVLRAADGHAYPTWIDFATGYTLADIRTADRPTEGGSEAIPSLQIILRDARGRTQTLWPRRRGE